MIQVQCFFFVILLFFCNYSYGSFNDSVDQSSICQPVLASPNGKESRQLKVRLRIFNAEPAPANSPFQVQILHQMMYKCSGAVLHKNWVMTAGHCLIFGNYGYAVLAGTSAVMDFQNGQLYEAQYVITHPKFSQLDNDIGLIKVNRTMEFSLNLQLTPISRTWYIPTDSVARVSGWGLTNMYSSLSPTLLQTYLRVIDQGICHLYWPSVTESQFCATGYINSAVCKGDSGSPVLIDGVVVGIVSYGSPYCPSPGPNVFTKVSAYIDWISQVMAVY